MRIKAKLEVEVDCEFGREEVNEELYAVEKASDFEKTKQDLIDHLSGEGVVVTIVNFEVEE